MKRWWTTKEHAQLLEMYPYFPNGYIAKKLDRTRSSIENRAIKFKLKKDRAFKDDGFLFLPGQAPWNKGKPHSPAGSEKGRFKPGHNLTRALPLGVERVREGVLERKVNDFRGPEHKKNFKPVKNITWEAVNGEIPKGSIVRVMTGNPHDATKIECLACVTRAENFLLNAANNNRSANAAKAWVTRREMEHRA